MNKDFYKLEYEKCILGIMLLENTLIDLIMSKISAEYFFNSRHADFYNEICRQYADKKCVSILTIATKFLQDAAYISSLTDSVSGTSNWAFYADEIKNLWLTRKIRNDLGDKIESLNTENVLDTIHDLDSSLTSYMKHDNGNPSDMRTLMMDITNDIEATYKKDGIYLGYDTGWSNLSDIIDGIQLQKLIVIGARPSVGKTAFSNQLISNLCKQDIPCCIFSLEMTAKMLMTRMIAAESNLTISSIRHGLCAQTQQGLQKLNIAMSKIYKYPLTIYDNGLKNEKELYSRIRVEAKTKGTKIFLIDHIGLVKYSNSNTKRVEALDDITQHLLHLAQELDISIIILSQLKRDAEGKTPTLADLRDSGSIEQNADICMFIHRERATSTQDSQIQTQIIIIKNRDGSCGTANMIFFPKSTKFVMDHNEDKFGAA